MYNGSGLTEQPNRRNRKLAGVPASSSMWSPCWQLLSRQAVWMVCLCGPAAFPGCLCGSCLSSHPLKQVEPGSMVVFMGCFFFFFFFLKEPWLICFHWLAQTWSSVGFKSTSTQEIQYCVGPHTHTHTHSYSHTHTHQESSWLRHQAHFICSWSAAAWRLGWKAVLSRSSLRLPEPWDYPPAVGICLPWPEFAHLYHSSRHWGEMIFMICMNISPELAAVPMSVPEKPWSVWNL